MEKIRVAFMADVFDRRPERTLFPRQLIEAFLENPRMEVTLVHFDPMPDERLYTRAREVLLPRFGLPWGNRFAGYLFYCLTTKDQFDIVHSFTVRLYPFFWLFPAKHRVVMAHGGGERLAPGKWTLLRFFFVWNLVLNQRHVDALIAVSEYANKEIIYAFRVPPEKVYTIYPHLDPLFASPPSREVVRRVLAEYDLEAGGYFVFVGRFRVHKNVGNLVEAYLRYREKNPRSTELLAIGGGKREEYERVFGSIRASAFSKDIRFLDYVPGPHLPALYAGARALAYISLNEGFGVPLIECMACGTPVITSSVTAMPEIAGDAALVVNPQNPDALAEAFRLISTDESLREGLIRRGRIRCRFFTWEKVLARTFALYDMLTADPVCPTT